MIEAHFVSNQDLSDFLDGLANYASYLLVSSVNQSYIDKLDIYVTYFGFQSMISFHQLTTIGAKN